MTDSNNCWRGYRETETLKHFWQDYKQRICFGKQCGVFKKVLSYVGDPAFSLLGGQNQEKLKTHVRQKLYIHIYSNFIHNSKKNGNKTQNAH